MDSPPSCPSRRSRIPYRRGGGSTPALNATTATQAKFDSTRALTVAPDGSVYLVDHANPAIYRIFPSGAMTRVGSTSLKPWSAEKTNAVRSMIPKTPPAARSGAKARGKESEG